MGRHFHIMNMSVCKRFGPKTYLSLRRYFMSSKPIKTPGSLDVVFWTFFNSAERGRGINSSKMV